MSAEVPTRAEDAEQRERFETLLFELSSRFISVRSEDLDRAIEEVQRSICELLGIDLSALWEETAEAPGDLVLTHFYASQEDLLPPMRGMSAGEHFPWLKQEMLAGRPVGVSDLDDLPEAAAFDRASLRQFGVKSNLTLPLSVGGAAPVAALGFNTTRAPRDWPDVLVTRLQLVGQVFANALARRRADAALRESEARSVLAADSAETGVWDYDYRTRIFWVSDRTRAIFHLEADDIVSIERLKAAIHPDDWPGVAAAIDRSAQSAEPVHVEYRIVLPSGEIRWILSRGRPHFSVRGEPVRLMGVSNDITDRKRGEEALRVSEERLEAGADLAGLAFYEIDYGNGAAYVDDRFRTVCGLPADREQGLQPFEFWVEHLHPDDRPRIMEARDRLHLGRVERLAEEYRYLHPALGQRWIQHMARAATRDAEGRVLKTFGVFRDVTKRRQAEESLRRSYEEIERLKDRLQAETDYLRTEIGEALAQGEITGKSAAVTAALRQVQQVAPTDSTVLVRGETGTGKELIARAIHSQSHRRHRVMVKVNCGALPSGLVESELFGRERGAFTGALTRQVGRFEVADGSTLFLDEVGELPPDVQVKLLRVLQEGEFERLGSPRTIKVDVRVIAATNRDLADDVRKGRFREDLFYRLNVFPIRMPPLRERAEDIPLLVWTFLEEFSSRMGKKITQVPRATMDALVRHAWPGNVRELRNVIEHAAIVTTGETLKVPLLGDAAPGAALPQTLTDVERDHILRTLETTGWRIKGPGGAAAALGLNPATLYSRMKKLAIPSGRRRAE